MDADPNEVVLLMRNCTRNCPACKQRQIRMQAKCRQNNSAAQASVREEAISLSRALERKKAVEAHHPCRWRCKGEA
jgi:hypothetical protein